MAPAHLHATSVAVYPALFSKELNDHIEMFSICRVMLQETE